MTKLTEQEKQKLNEIYERLRNWKPTEEDKKLPGWELLKKRYKDVLTNEEVDLMLKGTLDETYQIIQIPNEYKRSRGY